MSTVKLTYQEANNEKFLKKQEEVDLIHIWQNNRDPRALNRLVRSHARLAYSVAKKFSKNPEHIQDLAQEGMLGIMRAADKFDPEKGTRFATYARWWIKTFVTAALPQTSTVVDMPSRTYMSAKREQVEGENADWTIMAAKGPIDLDAPISDENGGSAMDTLECPRPNPEEAVSAINLEESNKSVLMEALDMLTDRERDVILRRKLSDSEETLEEIANSYNITRERVRQIESRALQRLKITLLKKGFHPSILRD